MTALIVIILSFFFTSSVWATYMSGLAVALGQGQFVQMTSANMPGWSNGSIMIGPGFPVDSFGNPITQYANKAVWNPIAKTFQFVGSPHGEAGVTNVKMVIYNDTTNTWSVGPTPNNSGNQPQHSYDHNTIDPATGRHYFTHYNTLGFQSLASGASSWTNLTSRTSGSQQCCKALAWFPDYNGGQVLWLDPDWGLWAWRDNGVSGCGTSTGCWTHLYRTLGQDGSGLAQLTGVSGTSGWMEYSALCHCVVLASSSTLWRINSDGSSTQLSLSGGPSSVTCCSSNSSITVDPVSGKFLIMQNTILWEFNPTNSAWVNTGVSLPGFLVGSGGAGFDMISAPISDYGVILYVKCSSSTCQPWLYRHAPSAPDTQNPTDPTNLVATPASSSQINLTWTASTDNVGVTGYNVERSPSGCGSFAEVYTPASNSQNDTGRSAFTQYCYRVRAHDAAGNSSGYSSSQQATTLAADTQAPTDPSNLQLTVISPSQINLTWTASTDNVAVTGYNVERCAGASCVNFVEVYTPASNSQNDTGLLSSTLYRYRVRAHDAAGNFSVGYTPVVQATTQTSSLPTVNAAAGEFTIIHIPDSQNEAASYPTVGAAQTQWIANNKTALNIQHVIHVGDMVDNSGTPAQWVNASNFMTTLDNASIPWSVSMGNHDLDTGTQQSTASGATWRTYFPLSRFSSGSTYVGFYTSGNNERNQMYHKFTVSGRCYLILALDYQAPDDSLTNAATITAANPTCRAIVATHDYLIPSPVGRNSSPLYLRTGGNNGEDIWQKFIKSQPMAQMVTSGHVFNGEANQVSIGNAGNIVNEIVADYQDEPNGGNGWLRIYVFKPAQNEIDAYTYSPYLDSWNANATNQFVMNTTSAPDTQAPTAPTNLQLSVISSSQINLTWTASTDNVAVTGYNIERCSGAGCSNFVEVYTPASNSQNDTGLVANTSYSYQIRAHDAVGNLSSYSTPVATVSTLPTAVGCDFACRCAAAGVLRCYGFDNAGTGTSDPNSEFFFGGGGVNGGYGYNHGYLPAGANYSYITRDTTVKSDGAASLRFTVPSNSGGSTSGSYFLNFTNPASYQVGPGNDVYIQWRNRFSPEQISNIYWGELSGQSQLTLGATSGTGVSATLSTSANPNFNQGGVGHHIYMNLGSVPAGSTGEAIVTSVQDSTHATVDITTTFNKLVYPLGEWTNDWGQSSWKIVDISAGDLPYCTPGAPYSKHCPTTCWDFETVITNNSGAANGYPTAYVNCAGPNAYSGLIGTNAPSGVTYQNVVDCPYPKPSAPPCFPLVADEWLTFQAHLRVGSWGSGSGIFQLWAAREGQASVLIMECSPTIAAPHKCGSPHQNGVNWFNSFDGPSTLSLSSGSGTVTVTSNPGMFNDCRNGTCVGWTLTARSLGQGYTGSGIITAVLSSTQATMSVNTTFNRLSIPVADYSWTNGTESAYNIGKFWMIPYQTGKSSKQTHPTAYVWYDEVIISTQKIADPGGTIPPVSGKGGAVGDYRGQGFKIVPNYAE